MTGDPQFPGHPSIKNIPPKKAEVFDEVKHSLADFSKEHGLLDLSDRIKRGLDPVGILAIEKTREKVQKLCERLHAPYEDVLQITVDIQKNGPWEYAAALKNASDPAIRVWMILNAVNSMGKEREMDLTAKEFIADLKRINALLEKTLEDEEHFFLQAKNHVLEHSQRQFRIQEGVPISEVDNGFIAMAINGCEGGIIQDADGLLFVGVKSIDTNIFSKWGLRREVRRDRGGRDVTFYVNEKKEELIKQLYPGYFIVLSRDFTLAKAIVKSAMGTVQESNLSESALGHKLYMPTSMGEQASASELASARKTLKPTKRIQKENGDGSEQREKFQSDFYKRLKYAKSTEIFRDKIPSLRKKKRSKKEKITHTDLHQEAQKTEEKVEQKMEELRYMMDIIRPTLKTLPDSVNKVMDMAGGAGDLGMAVTMEMLATDKPLKETHIVEPFAELQVFNRIILNELPRAEEFKKIITYDLETVQEAVIPADAIVVAKHACGDLTDAIIEEWVESESPLLAIMTCCQDKAKDQPARYGISQDEWEHLCRVSGKTGDTNPAHRAKGMEAMTRLDEARVAYLQRHGFEAELIQTDKFPKGDVIIARRKV
ncbi:MAG: methyltransferase [bacterium]|nr:methyltransferase [bacterium]